MAGAITLSQRMQGLAPSAVREILKVAERPDIISFAGGLPSPELFPVRELSDAYAAVLAESGPRALQYGITEGFLPLREWIAGRIALRGIRSSPEQLLVTSGSQQGIDLVSRVILDPGDVVVTENPTYLAALQAFASYQARVVAVGSDDQGMKVDELEHALAEHGPRLIYIVPDFQNPKGTSLSLERRRRLVELASRFGVPVLEDDPYGDLRFRGVTSPSIASFDEEGLVVQLGTFSKTLAPGLRIGWIHGSKELVRKVAIAKQAADLHTATLAQWVAARLLARFDLDGHLRNLRRIYGERCDAMLDALRRTMPPGCRWTEPEGGLFLWFSLPPGVRDDEVFKAAIARGVAVVPGSGFCVGPTQRGFLRLNYSNQTLDKIERGVGLLAEAIAGLSPRASAAAGAR